MVTRRSGFTLIELLVVIAIISILASILFPVFSRARAKARQAACISNEKQLVLAFLMYAEDFDEVLPPADAGGGTGYWGLHGSSMTNAIWCDAIYPYTRNHEIELCPENKLVLPGYAINDVGTPGVGQSLGSFFDTSSKVLLFDFDGSAPSASPAAALNGVVEPNIVFRHNEGLVVGYVDGHVKWNRYEAIAHDCHWDVAGECP